MLDLVYNNYLKFKNNPNAANTITNNEAKENLIMKTVMDNNNEMEIDDAPDEVEEEEMENEVDMKPVNEAAPKNPKNAEKEEFKRKLIELLQKNKYVDNRASKMDIDSFMNLLNIFNNNGIHFK